MTRSAIGRTGLLVATVVAAGGCKKREVPALREEPHGHGHAHETHKPGEEDLPTQGITVWTETAELFMEWPPLVAGQEAGFAAHLSVLPAGKPVTEATLTLTLTMTNGSSTAGRAATASSPGIFRPALTPPVAGRCVLSLVLEATELAETIAIGPCEVFSDPRAARAATAAKPEAPGGIRFLKEQQWKTEFETQRVAERPLQPSVVASGVIAPVAGKEAHLSAPIAGRLMLASPAPVLGTGVRRGQVLATIAARLTAGGDRSSLDSDQAAARAEADAALNQLERARRLLAEQAVPSRAVEEAQTRVEVTRARLAAAQGRIAQYAAGASGGGAGGRGTFQIRSPLDGTLVVAEPASGETFAEGAPLFTVIDLSRVWLEARVFEPDIPRVEKATGAWFLIEGYAEPFRVDARGGRLVAVGRVIDPRSRTVPVVFEVGNADGRLRIGQFAKVGIEAGATIRALCIPEPAIVEEAGRPIAYVQTRGETFERRPLRLGIRSLGFVQVLEGVVAGERVVTRGAYEVKLAASSGELPAHGHAH